MQNIDKIIPVFGTTDFLDPGILKTGNSRKFVVTGCARSGTQFMKLLLNSLDINVGHERLYSDGIVSWMIPHWNQAPGIKDAFFDHDTTYIHLVRNPVKVIRSISRLAVDPQGRIAYQALLHQFPSILKKLNKIEGQSSQIISTGTIQNLLGVENWIRWNAVISAFFNINATIRIEDLKTTAGRFHFAKLIGKPCSKVSRAIDALGFKKHSFPNKWCKKMDQIIGQPFSFEWLKKQDYTLYTRLIDAAELYGYLDIKEQ